MADLRATLPQAQEPVWLSKDEACEIPFQLEAMSDKDSRRDLAETLRETLAIEADVAVMPATGRRKKLLVADMDSTMIEQECLDELARDTGLYEKVAALTERAMQGEIDFDTALAERIAMFKGQGLDRIEKVIQEKICFSKGGKTLVATMKAHGAATVLVSGGFTLFTQPVATALGFGAHRSNRLEHQQGLLTGQIIAPILGRAAKRDVLLDFCKQRNIDAQEALAIGDGANDIDMIETAGLGLAYRAKPVLNEAADALIRCCDLTAALYFQGYRREEFA